MTAFWPPDPGYDPGPDAIEVTGLGDPVRTFIERGPLGAVILPPEPYGIMPGRDLMPEELAEFRRTWLALDAAGALGPPVTGAPARPDPAEEILAAIRDASPAACADCGRDDLFPGEDGRCRNCAELAALRVRKLSAWWFLVPDVLGLLLCLAVVWAILHVIFYGFG